MPVLRRIAMMLLVGILLTGCAPLMDWLQVPQPPDREVPVSEEAADRLVESWRAAMEQLTASGQATVQMHEEELTSFVRLRLSSEVPLPLTEPTVWFEADRIYLQGRLHLDQFPVDWPVLLVLTTAVEDGMLTVDVQQGAISWLPMPSILLSAVDQGVDAILTNLHTNFTIEQVRLEQRVAEISLRR